MLLFVNPVAKFGWQASVGISKLDVAEGREPRGLQARD